MLGKVIQSNARFGLTDRLDVHLDHVRVPVGNSIAAEKTKGRTLSVLRSIKKSTVVKAALLCLAHAIIIAMVGVNGDPKYRQKRSMFAKTRRRPLERFRC